MSLKRKKIVVALISLLAAASLFVWFVIPPSDFLVWFVIPPSAEQALNRFYTYGDDPDDAAAEDMLMDPLILAGEKVAPLVIREIKNKDMPKRRSGRHD